MAAVGLETANSLQSCGTAARAAGARNLQLAAAVSGRADVHAAAARPRTVAEKVGGLFGAFPGDDGSCEEYLNGATLEWMVQNDFTRPVDQDQAVASAGRHVLEKERRGLAVRTAQALMSELADSGASRVACQTAELVDFARQRMESVQS